MEMFKTRGGIKVIRRVIRIIRVIRVMWDRAFDDVGEDVG